MTGHEATNSSNNTISGCKPTLYNEKGSSNCKKYLQTYTNCLKGITHVNATPDVIVSNNFQQFEKEAEDTIRNLEYFGMHVRPQCHSSLVPLVCLYFIHLCDDGEDIGPSEDQCMHVSEVCDEELKQIKQILPTFSVDKYFSNCASKSPFGNKDCMIMSYNRTVSTHNCSAGFYKNSTEDGSCLPECNVWSPFPHITVLVTDTLNIFSAIVCIFLGGTVLVFSWIHCQKL